MVRAFWGKISAWNSGEGTGPVFPGKAKADATLQISWVLGSQPGSNSIPKRGQTWSFTGESASPFTSGHIWVPWTTILLKQVCFIYRASRCLANGQVMSCQWVSVITALHWYIAKANGTHRFSLGTAMCMSWHSLSLFPLPIWSEQFKFRTHKKVMHNLWNLLPRDVVLVGH